VVTNMLDGLNEDDFALTVSTVDCDATLLC
jgi:hypothetical protein